MVRAVLPRGVGVWHAHVRVGEELMEVVMYHPVRIPKEKRKDLAELLARVGPWNVFGADGNGIRRGPIDDPRENDV